MTGEPTTHPTIEPNLNGWTVRDIGVGNTHTVTAEDSSVISWGPSPSYGACGFGDPQETGIKSSTKPKQVDGLEGLHVASVACGYAHTVAIVATDAGGAPFPKKVRFLSILAHLGPISGRLWADRFWSISRRGRRQLLLRRPGRSRRCRSWRSTTSRARRRPTRARPRGSCS